MIAVVIGGTVMVTRHLDDWTRPPSGDLDSLPAYRAIAITLSRPLQLLEWKVYDFIHAFGAKTPADPDVVVLGIDEASLHLGESSAFPEDIDGSRPLQLMNEVYPWSREVYAHMIERLVEGGAQTVVIDLMFPGPHGGHPEGDDALSRCLEKYKKHVILAADIISQDVQNGQSESVQLPFGGLVEQKWPLDERIGFVSYWPDTDGVIRAARFHYSQDSSLPERTLHSFAAATLHSQGLDTNIPTDTLLHQIRFGDSSNFEPFSLHEIFIPSIWESNYGLGKRFAGKTVFLGTVRKSWAIFAQSAAVGCTTVDCRRCLSRVVNDHFDPTADSSNKHPLRSLYPRHARPVIALQPRRLDRQCQHSHHRLRPHRHLRLHLRLLPRATPKARAQTLNHALPLAGCRRANRPAP
jgi:hypothetical protein